MNLKVINKFLTMSVLFITLFSVLPYPNLQIPVLQLFNITFVWWVIIFAVLFAYFKLYSGVYRDYIYELKLRWLPVIIYLSYNVLQFFHGAFVSEIYWDWKGLIENSFGLLLPIASFIAIYPQLLSNILRTYLKYAIPLFFIFFLIITKDAYGFYLAPIALFIFFIPMLTLRWRLLIVLASVVVLISDLGARSNVIKFALPYLILVFYYFRGILSTKLLNIGRQLLMVLPFILFGLAVVGIFNIFKMQDYVDGEYVERKKDVNGEQLDDDLKADTRTFIYIEILTSAKKYDSWVFGRSPARGNDTEAFAESSKAVTGREERLGNEVAIANIFTWTGIIGVILYAIVFLKASYLAVNKSHNFPIKLIGLFVAFRWAYAWVEDVNNFSLNYFSLWIMIGMCFSRSFREMSDLQIKYWIRGIFDIRYRRMLDKKQIKPLTDKNKAN